MRLLVLAFVFGLASAAPRYGDIRSLSTQRSGRDGFIPYKALKKHYDSEGFDSDERFSLFTKPSPESLRCGSNEVLNEYGLCEEAVVTRNVYAFTAPKIRSQVTYPLALPDPEMDLNIIFVKAPDSPNIPKPFVMPPPQQRTVVYVLSEQEKIEPEVIKVPGSREDPEVYFVNYQPGENADLPGGIDLATALQQAVVPGAVSVEDHGHYGTRQLYAAERVIPKAEPEKVSSYSFGSEESREVGGSFETIISKLDPENVSNNIYSSVQQHQTDGSFETIISKINPEKISSHSYSGIQSHQVDESEISKLEAKKISAPGYSAAQSLEEDDIDEHEISEIEPVKISHGFRAKQVHRLDTRKEIPSSKINSGTVPMMYKK